MRTTHGLVALFWVMPLPAASFVRNYRACCNHNPWCSSTTALGYRNCDLPSVQEVSEDEFTDQVYHANVIVRELNNAALKATTPPLQEEEKDALRSLITAQLSHQDGIRGFFTAYVTGEGENTAADEESMPQLLFHVLKGSNHEDLAPLVCMNAMVPTAMKSVYKDPILVKNSAIVADRALRVLKSFKGSINIVRNCDGIRVAATGVKDSSADPQIVHFWEAVFDQFSYNAEQRRDIADAFATMAAN